MFINLTDKEIEKLAEEMRIRHYNSHFGEPPHTPFKDLVGDRRKKWLDVVNVAIELLLPYIAK
jgi:hypothetical protein